MKRILLVVDMVNDFVDGSLGTKEAVAIVPAVIAKIKEYEANGDEIVFLRDTHEENYLDTQEGKFLPVKHTIRDTNGWLVADEIRKVCDTQNYLNLEKNTFACVALKDYLEKLDEPFEVELVGVCTGICVISNAFFIKGYYPEAKIVVDSACCACVTQEAHERALEAMKLCHIIVK